MDGSVFSTPGCMYAGVIFHNSRGFFVGAFCSRIGRDTVQKKIHLIPWRLRGLWCRVMQMAFDMMIMYSHTVQEANKAADALAKLHRDVV
ncbi:hypothetical protein ACS0TY_034242 [Phlomoides rotata]